DISLAVKVLELAEEEIKGGDAADVVEGDEDRELENGEQNRPQGNVVTEHADHRDLLINQSTRLRGRLRDAVSTAARVAAKNCAARLNPGWRSFRSSTLNALSERFS